MAYLKTSKGPLQYRDRLFPFRNSFIDSDSMIKSLEILAIYLDKIDINWGPAFGTLIGIVRNDGFLPWATVFDAYILKEDEERFKDILWFLEDAGFSLVRYERRGLYYLEHNQNIFKIFVLRKVSSGIRHTGGVDFIFEKYLQNTTKWNFKGIDLNVPQELDEYLTFQYGDWIIPKQTMEYRFGMMKKIRTCVSNWINDHLPSTLYWWRSYRKRLKYFKKFRQLCMEQRVDLQENIELSYNKPLKNKRIFTVGVYDLIHKGHAELFRRARGLGDSLIVAVQDGDSILKYKPTAKVLNSTEDRMYMVKSIRWVDEVITYAGVDDIVKKVDFDVFVTGPDQIHDGFQRAIKWCEENGREHIILARTDGVSSSELKAKIAEKSGK